MGENTGDGSESKDIVDYVESSDEIDNQHEETGAEEEGQPELEVDQTKAAETKQAFDFEQGYKTLQGEFQERNVAFKDLVTQFDEAGGIENVLEVAKKIQGIGGESIDKFVKDQKDRDILNVPEGDLDPEQRDALNIIKKLVEEGNSRVLKEVERKIKPIAESNFEERSIKLEQKMDESFQNDGEVLWRQPEVLGTMKSILANYSEEQKSKIGFREMQGVFAAAMNYLGKDVSGNDLSSNGSKKIPGMEKPSKQTQVSTKGKATTIDDAWTRALKKFGK